MPRLGDAAVRQPLFAFAVGFLWLAGTPVLAVVSAFTIIGLPLAILVLLLWPLGILAGLVAAILALGEIIAARFTFTDEGPTRRIAGIALATVILWIGISLPALGGLVWLGAVTLGVGAIALAGRAHIDGL